MQLKQFTKPIQKVTELAAEMKRFLRGHRVQAVRQEFVADGEHSCWSDRVEYLDGAASKEGGGGTWRTSAEGGLSGATHFPLN